jgi:hypothetical protein
MICTDGSYTDHIHITQRETQIFLNSKTGKSLQLCWSNVNPNQQTKQTKNKNEKQEKDICYKKH